ncbi:MAG: phytanoyl-CoA dioxygenase family protein [Caulobacteraceae bacterium]
MSRVRQTLRWALLPYWLVRVFSEEKSFDASPILGDWRLNRRGFYVWRARLAARLTAWRRARLARLVSDEDRRAFHRDGFVAKPDFVPPALFTALTREIGSFTAAAGEFKEGNAITRRIPLTPENLKRLPACRALLQLPEWRGLTRYVSSFDSDPLVFIQTIFTHAAEGQTDPQTSLHIDTFHPTMKAWLFLEDVDDADGPFCYSPGSHRRTPRREAWERRKSCDATRPGSAKKGGSFRLTKSDLARIGAAKPRRFPVPANTLVVADTHGFHARCLSQRPSVRVEIWAYSRRNPFSLWTRFDPAALPLFKGRAAPIGWWFMELRRRLGMPAPQFRRAPRVRPAAPPEPWPSRS